MPATELINNPWSAWTLLTMGTAFMIGPAFSIAKGKKSGSPQEKITNEHIALQQANKAMQGTEQKLQTIIAATTEGFWIIEPTTGKISEVNEALCDMLGYPQQEIIGKSPLDFADRKNQVLIQHREGMTFSAPHRSYEATLLTKNGGELHVRINATTVMGRAQTEKAPMSFAFISDISEKKIHEEELYRQAHYDSTTKLPNRYFLIKHIEALIGANETFGLLLIDIDNFKIYNDTFGQTYGDLLLKSIAERLEKNLHETDFLARLGGDEFVVVSRQRQKHVEATAQRLLNIFGNHPIEIQHNELYASVSIGITGAPHDGADVDQLLRCADLAMHEAKNNGKCRISIYSTSLDQGLLEKIELGNKLRKALQNNEFSIRYQPQISASTESIVGIEALLRWNNKELGVVAPDKFIPVLEETGLIVPVGEWVLRTACQQAKTWHAAGHHIRLSVNLSSRQFQETDLANSIQNIITETGIDPSLLMLEITESLLIGDIPQVTNRLKYITDLGCCFSIDDFGTGYSSLSYLQKLPIKEVKIDQSFVKNLTRNKSDMMIVKTIIAIANYLGMETVAEGVEEISQLEALKAIGATMVQGFHTGRPMSPGEITDILAKSLKAKETNHGAK